MSVTLGDIPLQSYSLHVQCGHSSVHSVADLLEVFPKEMTFGNIKRNARCTHCRQKGQVECRILYVGGSRVAMRGGDQEKPKDN